MILGEAALSPTDVSSPSSPTSSSRYVAPGAQEDRTIFRTLDLGWELLSMLPVRELKRVREEFITEYMPEIGGSQD